MRQLQGKFGTITICPPERKPTPEDEKRLYSILIECLLAKKKEGNEREFADVPLDREHKKQGL